MRIPGGRDANPWFFAGPSRTYLLRSSKKTMATLRRPRV